MYSDLFIYTQGRGSRGFILDLNLALGCHNILQVLQVVVQRHKAACIRVCYVIALEFFGCELVFVNVL